MNTPTPRHLAPHKETDSGLSYIWESLAGRTRDPKHAAPVPANPYKDVWAGNPDTDKHWEKNR